LSGKRVGKRAQVVAPDCDQRLLRINLVDVFDASFGKRVCQPATGTAQICRTESVALARRPIPLSSTTIKGDQGRDAATADISKRLSVDRSTWTSQAERHLNHHSLFDPGPTVRARQQGPALPGLQFHRTS
jgi:hypothetical protein